MQDVGFSFSKNCITIWFQTVLDVFEAEIEATALSCSRDGPLEIAADGRCDSPGHCALYGIVTFMDCRTNKIVATSLVKASLSCQNKTFSGNFFYDVFKKKRIFKIQNIV